ncbi:MAG: SHOCT domain-containing protein [Epsilonproteobacteria bacterium]|nr:SHOCT domain-containing protein [Campylobacterota bacterium]
MGNYMMAGGGIMFIGFILLVGILIYFIFQRTQKGSNQTSQSQSKSALDILKKRFANSEISEEEYLAKKNILS